MPANTRVPIKEPNRVWTVIGAVAGSYATVVDHGIETIGSAICCVRRTDWFAWCVTTVLAKNRNETNLDIGECAFVVSLDAQPVHRSTLHRFFFTDSLDVVLCVAGDYATLATSADICVYYHSPARHPSLRRFTTGSSVVPGSSMPRVKLGGTGRAAA